MANRKAKNSEPLPVLWVDAGDGTFRPTVDIQPAVDELKAAIQNLTEASVDTGVADATSTVNQLDDSAKDWPVNGFENLIVEITKGTGAGQIRKIASNTATSLVPVAAFTTAPDATSEYRIGFFGKVASELTSWGGTALTGRDVSLDLAKLDLALTALRDAITGAAPNNKTLNDLLTELQAKTEPGDAQSVAGIDVNLSTRASEATLASLLLDATFTGRIGEVQAAPTANTVLDRLKQIFDKLNAQLDITNSVLREGLSPLLFPIPGSNILINPTFRVPNSGDTAPVGWTLPANSTWNKTGGPSPWAGFVEKALGINEEFVQRVDHVQVSRAYAFGALIKGGGLTGLKLAVFEFNNLDALITSNTVLLESDLGTDWVVVSSGFISASNLDHVFFSLKNEGAAAAPLTTMALPFLTPL